MLIQKAFLDTILSENPGLPCFCFAHSTGAAIVLKVSVLSLVLLLKNFHYFSFYVDSWYLSFELMLSHVKNAGSSWP